MSDNNNRRREKHAGKEPIGKSGRRSGSAPQTTETGAQNSGGQTERGADKMKKNKHSGGR